MLLQFSVTNHRSIKDTAVISMLASKDKSLSESIISPDGKKELLPVIAIYGANAAGKSNLLHAILTMRDMVVGESAKSLKGQMLPQDPFVFGETQNAPTSFEMIYYYKGIKYAYGYSFNYRNILEEYLYHWPNNRELLVFQRNENKYSFRENINEQMTLASRTPDNRLYLVTSNEWNCPQTEMAFQWFQKQLTGFMGNEYTLPQTIAAIRSGKDSKKYILNEMLLADLGISDITVTGGSENPAVTTTHRLFDIDGKETAYELRLDQESQGTKRFFSRIGCWLEALKSGAVLIVDELEASLHPLLTRHLIEMMMDASINVNHAQLIFTTHDAGILDITLLRRDQIWFAEKNEKTAATEIYALSEFSPRKGENVHKGYLQGRYGAIPFIRGGDSPWEG